MKRINRIGLAIMLLGIFSAIFLYNTNQDTFNGNFIAIVMGLCIAIGFWLLITDKEKEA